MKNIILSLVLVALCQIAASQSFIGVHSSNYDALKGHTFNPGLTPMSYSKWEVNLVGIDMNLGNDYISLKGGISDFRNGFDIEENLEENLNGTDKNLRLANDVHLPSFMFNIPKIGAFTFQNRVRAIVDFESVSEELLTSVFNDPNNIYNWVNFEDDEMSVNVNSYTEIGIGYGRYIIERPKHALSVGVNFKLLTPVIAASVYGENLNFDIDSIEETANFNNTHIVLNASESIDDIVDEEFKYKFGIKGFGFDAGLAYEFKPGNGKNQLIDRSNRSPKSSKEKANPDYLLKVGVGFIDFGRVKFDQSKYSRDFQADGSTVSLDDITVDEDSSFVDFDDVMNALGSFEIPTEALSTKLPFAMTLFADLKLTRTLYVNFSSLINIGKSDGDKLKARQQNNFYVTPRFEFAQFGVQVPFGYNPVRGFELGTSIRFSNFVIGSTNLFSSLWNKSFDGINLQFAMAFGGVRKNQINSEEMITPEVDEPNYYDIPEEDLPDEKTKNKKERRGVGD